MQPARSSAHRSPPRVLPGDGPGRESGGVAGGPTPAGGAASDRAVASSNDHRSTDYSQSGAFQ